MLNVLFLWHMHQPYYVNPLTHTAMMPWVRLHAVRGYYDMIWTAQRHASVHMNFNFAPVLLKQLDQFVKREVRDLWESWSRTPAEELKDFEKQQILRNHFSINWENHIKPFPRYNELLEKRNAIKDSNGFYAVDKLSAQEYRDLQVWFNLAWCGFAVENDFPLILQLKKKARDFSEEDKNALLDLHYTVMEKVLPLYKQAQENGNIELTTTPFYHPILPLVYDTDFAKRCMPERTLPSRFSSPEDAKKHLVMAQEEYEKHFGKKSRGLWPSEGSVCPELIPLIRECGFEYFCTDEGNLFNSLRQDPYHQHRHIDHLELFQSWNCEFQGQTARAFFRERALSDYIGFDAARVSGEEGAQHLIQHFEHLHEVVHNHEGCVFLVLDGENPWEAFKDGGKDFLRELYEKLARHGNLKTRKLGDFVDQTHESPVLRHLHTGSWIYSNFDIWIADPEENQAWEYVKSTREFLVYKSQEKKFDPAKLERAWQSIYAAEGSDWFWWFGPDFNTIHDYLFDELFRQHLQNVYLILEETPPPYLDWPIRRRRAVSPYTPPFRMISPQSSADMRPDYFGWLGAGTLDLTARHSAMFNSHLTGKKIWFGYDLENFFMRLDFIKEPPKEIVLRFYEPRRNLIHVKYDEEGAKLIVEHVTLDNEIKVLSETRISKKECAHACVLKASWEQLGVQLKNEKISFDVELLNMGQQKERYPEQGVIEFAAPDPKSDLKEWLV